jgi:hypothetical protein
VFFRQTSFRTALRTKFGSIQPKSEIARLNRPEAALSGSDSGTQCDSSTMQHKNLGCLERW